MDIIQLATLAVIQGMTEFLPVSSSGHLALVPFFTGWSDQGQNMDVAMHIGTLVAVITYFWRDVSGMAKDAAMFPKSGMTRNIKLIGMLLIATLPVILVGLVLKAGDIDLETRDPTWIAYNLMGFGILLYLADRYGKKEKMALEMRTRDAVLIGLAQVFALIPGTSRSGITMSAARALGYTRAESARFSMLLSIPAISAAGILVAYEIYKAGGTLTLDMLIGASIAALTGWFAIAFMMKWLRNASFLVFVVYRMVLGLVILSVVA